MARTNQEAVTAFGEILRSANVPGSYNSQNNRMAANDNRIFIACGATDFRKQIPGLAEELLMLRTLAAKQAQELEASKRIIAERDEKIRKQNIQINNMIQSLTYHSFFQQ